MARILACPAGLRYAALAFTLALCFAGAIVSKAQVVIEERVEIEARVDGDGSIRKSAVQVGAIIVPFDGWLKVQYALAKSHPSAFLTTEKFFVFRNSSLLASETYVAERFNSPSQGVSTLCNFAPGIPYTYLPGGTSGDT